MQLRALALVLVLLAPAALPLARAALPEAGAAAFETARYRVSLQWPLVARDGVVVQGEIRAEGHTGRFAQTLRATDAAGAVSAAAPLFTVSAEPDFSAVPPTLLLRYKPTPLYPGVAEAASYVRFTFFPDRIHHESSFRAPSAAVAPVLESTTTLAWTRPFALAGSVDADGAIAYDGGASLDAYGADGAGGPFGVFHSEPGGLLVGHARIDQGSFLNYVRDGSLRVDPRASRVVSQFNAFLDAPTVGAPQDLWSLDAIVLLPGGATPGAYADYLADFPAAGDAPFSPPAPGDLAGRGQVVIAIPDTGINPYHEDFVNPAFTAHPSTYLRGYPASAPALNLTFGADYATSRGEDDGPVWSKVQAKRLYWIPGTKIVGAIGMDDEPGALVAGASGFPDRRILDDQGHGTATASVAAGYRHGACEACLLVIIEGSEDGVRWAAAQPWIDVISNSYGPVASLPFGNSDAVSLLAYRAGKSVLYSAGNGMTGVGPTPDRNPTLTRPGSGPSWVITVGAASPRNEQASSWHGVPVDVVSYGSAYPAAAPFATTGTQLFGGTSCATPLVAGFEGALLLAARRALGDADEGPRPGAVAAVHDGVSALPASGPLADGALTRDELETVLLRTAIPTAFDPTAPLEDPATTPATPAAYAFEGYGIVNRASLARGVAVLAGEAPLPDRGDVDRWILLTDALRDAIWGEP